VKPKSGLPPSTRQIKSIIGAIADGIATREMKTTLLEIDREKQELENECTASSNSTPL